MELINDLNIRQEQKLKITPELRQALNVLQMSSLELDTFIGEQLLENPLLEKNEILTEDLNGKDNISMDEMNYLTMDKKVRKEKEDNEYLSFELFVSKEISLYEYLEEQIKLLDLEQEEYYIACYIIGNLNSWGFFPYSIEEGSQDLMVEEGKFAKILSIIQNLEPDGIGARNIEECLIIQLKKRNIVNPLLEKIIKDFLPDIGQGKLVKVSKHLSISLQELQENIDIIKTLNPKPGASLIKDNNINIVPDLILNRIGNKYEVRLNDNISSLFINQKYMKLLKDKNIEDNTKCFIESKYKSAIWLLKSIEQRKFTLLRIAEFIVERQRDFLDKGIKYLKTMTLKEVADSLSVHESTISRATANKYMRTTRGLYPLKYFFSTGISNKMGKSISTKAIKKEICDMISRENLKMPLSDQQISELLKEKGIKVARRTVAKYRESMGILPSQQRKRY